MPEGHVAWSSDYHEYFEINNVPRKVKPLGLKVPLAVLKSKLNFNGRAGAGNFLTLGSVCLNSTTSHLEVESYAGEISRTETHTPAGVDRLRQGPLRTDGRGVPGNRPIGHAGRRDDRSDRCRRMPKRGESTRRTSKTCT